MKLFHGTTYESYQGIKEDIAATPDKTIWICSEDDVIYFHSLDVVAKDSSLDLNDLQSAIYQTIQRAFESAQVSAAVSDSDQLIVLEFDVDESLVKPDTSCQNADTVCVSRYVLTKEMIVDAYTMPFNKALKLFHLVGLIDKDDFIDLSWHLSKEEYEAVRLLADNDIYLPYESLCPETWSHL